MVYQDQGHGMLDRNMQRINATTVIFLQKDPTIQDVPEKKPPLLEKQKGSAVFYYFPLPPKSDV
jgi:hypothetical protein